MYHQPEISASKKQWGGGIIFCDSDDYIDKDFFESLYAFKDCDLVIGNFSIFETNEDIFEDFHMPAGIYSNRQIGKLLRQYTSPNFTTPWAKLFKKSAIDRLGLRFNPKLIKGEDTIFVFQYLHGINELACVGGDSCYNYRFGLDGLHTAIDFMSNLQLYQELVANFAELAKHRGLDENDFYPHYTRGTISNVFPNNFANFSYGKIRETLKLLKSNKNITHLFDVLQRNNCGIKAKVFFKLYNSELIIPLMIWMKFCRIFKKQFA